MTKRRGDDVRTATSADLAKRVAEWLRTGGYPLDMTVARGLRDVGFTVTQSDRYADVEKSILREIDAVARWTQPFRAPGSGEPLLAALSITVECKWSEDRPWVLFVDPGKSRASARDRLTNVQAKWLIERFPDAWTRTVLDSGSSRAAYGVVPTLEKGEDFGICRVPSGAQSRDSRGPVAGPAIRAGGE
jgi:hypothetical protein